MSNRSPFEDLYEYYIQYNLKDKVFVARISEFKSLAAHGDTMEEALKEIRSLVSNVIQDLLDKKEGVEGVPLPKSVAEKLGPTYGNIIYPSNKGDSCS